MSGAARGTLAETIDRTVYRVFWPGSEPLGVCSSLAILVACACVAGWGVGAGSSLEQALYSALKLPLLLVVSASVALPGFIAVIAAVDRQAGVLDTVRLALCGQAATAVALSATTPLILFLHATGLPYEHTQRSLAVAFFLASAAGQISVYRHGERIVRSRRVLRAAAAYWGVLYPFVGVQGAWVLRPFVGAPGAETAFLREDAWTNAYVAVSRLLFGTG